MQELLDWLEYIEDDRQQRKIRHTLKDILVIVLFATLANADDWVEMALFAENYQDYLRKYIELKNGIPSHDTIRRVMGMISPEILQQLYGKWQDRLNQDDGELLKKIICIDGKTMRSNKRGAGKAAHIVSAWSKEDGFCLRQKAVEEKSNEIVVIPELLDKIQIKGQTVTIDAMGTKINPAVTNLYTFAIFMIVPFNLVKCGLNAIVTALVYKHVSVIIHAGVHREKKTENTAA